MINKDAYYAVQTAWIESGENLGELPQLILLMMALFSDDEGCCVPSDVTESQLKAAALFLNEDMGVPYPVAFQVWRGVQSIPGNEPDAGGSLQ